MLLFISGGVRYCLLFTVYVRDVVIIWPYFLKNLCPHKKLMNSSFPSLLINPSCKIAIFIRGNISRTAYYKLPLFIIPLVKLIFHFLYFE
jgi:hypothetical protein